MIVLQNACKIYKKNGVAALWQVDLRVRAGQYVSVSGASGSGKSTLMHVLGLLDRLTAGDYFFGGQDVSALSPRALSRLRGREIGFVFQQFRLLGGMTAQDNVALPLLFQGVPRAERRRRALEGLAAVGLSDRADHTPGQLSGGQQQRVAVARALITHPRVILADEPTAGLDPAAAREVLALFDRLHEAHHTILLITHDRAAAACAPRRLSLQHGILREET